MKTETTMTLHRLMSQNEVAGILNVSPTTLSKMVLEGEFPSRIAVGKSARTGGWEEATVREWIGRKNDQARNGSIAYKPLFHTLQDIAALVDVQPIELFSLLKRNGVLIESDLEAERNRPSLHFMKLGYFWRIEKFHVKNESTYFQTVVTPMGKEPILALVRDLIAADLSKQTAQSRKT